MSSAAQSISPNHTHHPQSDQSLLRTPLYDLHIASAAKMAGFAGYDMPIQYPLGIIKEHLHTRSQAGLFDVSHMGQIKITAFSGKLADAQLALESVMPADIIGLAVGRQTYSQFTTQTGGISDDLMVAHYGDFILLVVNAGGKIEDLAMLQTALSDRCKIEYLADRALIAVQGPMAESVMAPHAPDLAKMRFMEVRRTQLLGADIMVSRSGYTGEDGYEISLPASDCVRIVRELLHDPRLQLIGLGARDSLRLEAGLCLYGSDIDKTTSPIEAGIGWSIGKARRAGGARAGGFIGDHIILNQMQNGVTRRRVGIRTQDRAPIRGGTQIYAQAMADKPIGMVTSGGFGPSVNGPVAMGYINSQSLASPLATTVAFAELRGRFVPVNLCDIPFVPLRYAK
ncbi:MAG: glycine cleavage system aminomethyltransferase GcvT [Alphaproteobacteria bacterium]|nr:glycine cleavage system aminomethyltransferase GcvT [Alphaproteobacteria bacterium]